MSDELRFPDPNAARDRDSIPEPLRSLVRNAYAPPVNPGEADAYWTGLEQRIMARVSTEGAGDGRWWTVLAPWARTGLIAAAAIFAMAGVIDSRLSDTDERYAYEAVVETPAAEVIGATDDVVLVRDTPVDEGAALYYVSN